MGRVRLGTGKVVRKVAAPVPSKASMVRKANIGGSGAAAGAGVIVVRLASTANVTTNGNQTLDGVAVANNDEVLLKDQTIAANRGRWRVNTAGDWVRMDQPSFVVVKAGNTNGRTAWILTGTNTYEGLDAIPV